MSRFYIGALIVSAIAFSSAGAFAITSGNLLLNPGAELGTGNDEGSTVTDWTVGGTSNPGRDNGAFDGFTPHSGSYDFYGGSGSAFPDQSPKPAGSLSQTVNLVASGVSASGIDAGTDSLNVEFFEVSLDQGQTPLNDAASVDIVFLNSSMTQLSGGYHSGEISNITVPWQEVSGSVPIPATARYFDYTMNFYLNAGTDVDSFVDDNSATVSTTPGGNGPSPVPLPAASSTAMAGLFAMLIWKVCRGKFAAAR
jgi:hypothetical protein